MREKQGWDVKSVNEEPKADQEKNRAVRVRQRAIGRELRRMYDDVVREPVPDDFLSLLHEIDERHEAKSEKPEES